MPHTSLRILRDEHASLGSMLRAMRTRVQQGPGDHPQRYFDVLRAMLFYIDEFPERLHHTKESTLLFPRVLRAVPSLRAVIDRLDQEHRDGERTVRELQHLLLAWELLGEGRRGAFERACLRFLDFYQEHMALEETVVLPEAERCMTEADWSVLDAAFRENMDPLGGKFPTNPAYDRLFTRIVLTPMERESS